MKASQAHLRQNLLAWMMGFVPALAALGAVLVEPWLTAWSKGRMAALPLATLLLLSVLVHPRLRHLLMITLCYGVSFLALRDIVRLSSVAMPEPLNYDGIEMSRTASLLLVAGLSATAAIGETVSPGTVWARRCYFGAASLYFFGLGLINYLWHPSWQGLMLCGTGVTAGVGCVFADRIVATEAHNAKIEAEESDEILQQARETAHRAALQAKEWRDGLDSLVAPRDDRDTPTVGSA